MSKEYELMQYKGKIVSDAMSKVELLEVIQYLTSKYLEYTNQLDGTIKIMTPDDLDVGKTSDSTNSPESDIS